MSESNETHLRLRVKQLICGSLNGENQTVLDSHTYLRQGHGSLGRRSGWEPEFRDCGAVLR